MLARHISNYCGPSRREFRTLPHNSCKSLSAQHRLATSTRTEATNMANESNLEVHGSCYCGGVRFSISAGTELAWSGYCHCKDCRQAHASPLYQAVYVEESRFQVTAGEDLLKWYTRAESARDRFKRYFCGRCGSKVYNTMTDEVGELRGTFPSLFDDQTIATSSTWSPREHLSCAESIMDLSLIQDYLPRIQNQ